MADLTNVLNDCIDRLSSGQTIQDCLRLYPNYAQELAVLLEAGRLAQRARYRTAEVALAQQRQRYKVEQAVANFQPQPVAAPRGGLLTLVRLAAVLLVVLGAVGIVAQNSLPGDTLYGVKRLTENVRLTVSGNSSELQQQWDTRRVSEVQQLLSLRREQAVTFRGQVESAQAAVWQVAGVELQITAATTVLSAVTTGEMVEVEGHTTADGKLVATTIRPVNGRETQTLPIPTSTETPLTPPVSPTQPPTSTVIDTTVPPTPVPPSITPTPTLPPSLEPTLTETPSPTLSPTPEAATCIPQRPAGWETYIIQLGDSLPALAAQRGVSQGRIISVNCLTDPNLLMAGQKLYLPALPTVTPAPPSSPTENAAPGSNNSSGSNNGTPDSGGSGEDHSGDNGGDQGGSGHG